MADGRAAHAHQGSTLPRMDGVAFGPCTLEGVPATAAWKGGAGHAAIRGRQMGGRSAEPGHGRRSQAAGRSVPDGGETGEPNGADWNVRRSGDGSHGGGMPQGHHTDPGADAAAHVDVDWGRPGER
eukprot:780818-Alexandrium_andersonii.AAC.1